MGEATTDIGTKLIYTIINGFIFTIGIIFTVLPVKIMKFLFGAK